MRLNNYPGVNLNRQVNFGKLLLTLIAIFLPAIAVEAQENADSTKRNPNEYFYHGKKYYNLEYKSRQVYLDKELQEASIVQYAEIVEYIDSNDVIVFQPIGSKEKMAAKTGGLKHINQQVEMFTTDYWPGVGEKLLVVVGQDGFISLFATKQKEYYRFWSPIYTGGVAIFFFKPPVIKMRPALEASETTGNFEVSPDGVLSPIDYVKLKAIKRSMHVARKKS